MAGSQEKFSLSSVDAGLVANCEMKTKKGVINLSFFASFFFDDIGREQLCKQHLDRQSFHTLVSHVPLASTYSDDIMIYEVRTNNMKHNISVSNHSILLLFFVRPILEVITRSQTRSFPGRMGVLRFL
jgi:hypothetical protein